MKREFQRKGDDVKAFMNYDSEFIWVGTAPDPGDLSGL